MRVEKRLLAACLLSAVVGGLPGRVMAWDCRAYGSAEAWSEQNVRLVGLDLTVSGCDGKYGVVRGGLSYYADDEFLYEGLTGSFRVRAGNAIAPYVGFGVLAGIGKKSVDANDDGIDNDDDGLIDEGDEEVTRYGGSAYAYPEVGVELFTGNVGIVLSARKYYGREFDGDIIYSLGVALRMGR